MEKQNKILFFLNAAYPFPNFVRLPVAFHGAKRHKDTYKRAQMQKETSFFLLCRA
jgi:hypothetical protein